MVSALGRFHSFVAVTAMVVFAALYLFHNEINIILPPNEFISTHIILEFSSIVISIAIALQGWFTFPFLKSRRHITVGAVFLAVGLLDLMHTLSYQGMPWFVTASSVAKATWFWIAARLTEAAALTLSFALPCRRPYGDNYRLMYLAAPVIPPCWGRSLLPIVKVCRCWSRRLAA